MTDLFEDNSNSEEFNIEELLTTDTKYKDMSQEDLRKKALHADMTINVFKRRQDEMRADFLKLRDEHMTGTKLQELVDQLAAAKQSQSSSDNTQANDVKVPSIDLNDIDARVTAKIQESKALEKAEQNFNQVMGKLQESHGNSYKAYLKEQADKLGFTTDDVNALARKSPDAFYRTFGLDQQRQEGFQSPPNSVRRSDSFTPSNQKRTWTYYQDLKAKNPTAYYAAKTHNQMLEDYKTLGENFEDGDFHRSWSV